MITGPSALNGHCSSDRWGYDCSSCSNYSSCSNVPQRPSSIHKKEKRRWTKENSSSEKRDGYQSRDLLLLEQEMHHLPFCIEFIWRWRWIWSIGRWKIPRRRQLSMSKVCARVSKVNTWPRYFPVNLPIRGPTIEQTENAYNINSRIFRGRSTSTHSPLIS